MRAMNDQEKQRKLEDTKKAHPVGDIRYYFGKKCEVVGYEQVESGYVYVICNVEDPYRMGFKTKYLTPDCLKKQ